MALPLNQTAAAARPRSEPGTLLARGLQIGAPRPGARERMLFSERLALLLETGSSLHVALAALEQQADTPGLKAAVADLGARIGSGATFADALRAHPELFPESYVNLVAASEQGGFLPTVLERLREMDEREVKLRATVRGAMFYPAFLVSFSLGVVVFVLVVVFPKFAEMFASIADRLPLTTIVLMRASELILAYWPWILAGLGALAWGLVHWARTPAGKALLDRAKLGMFPLREIYAQLYLVQSMRVISLSLGNGVSVPETLVACRNVVGNVQFRALIDQVMNEVNEGRGMARAFQASPFMPALVKQMLATGEESGKLPLVTARIADFYEAELGRRLTGLAKIIEPLMLVVMGAVVGLLVSALVLPIFKLSQAVH